jgi:two-component system, chemotaxis family, response regulator WspF
MKIGIVNDMALAVEALRRVVASKPEHQIIWVARNGTEAVELSAKTTPDLILMDLIMPGMDGVEATRRIMTRTPCAILVVTASVGANAARVFEAMGYGALDAVDTPALSSGNSAHGAAALLGKIATIGKLIGDRIDISIDGKRSNRAPSTFRPNRLIAIGASAGGPAALAKVLSGLPHGFPASVVVIQHVDEQFAAGMAEWLNQHSTFPVRVAEEGDRPTMGTVLLAGTGDHLALKTPERLGYTADPSDYVYRPSVDVFFQSITLLWPGEATGVLLTGMGKDGALGLKAMRNKGYYTIAQDEASSAVYGMPKAAAAVGAAVDILPLEDIAPRLVNVLRVH